MILYRRIKSRIKFIDIEILYINIECYWYRENIIKEDTIKDFKSKEYILYDIKVL